MAAQAETIALQGLAELEGAMQATEAYYGPYLGEMGHELMNAGVIRRMAKDFKKVTVCSRPGMKPVYADFCTHFVPHNIACEGNCGYARDDTSAKTIMAAMRLVPRKPEVMAVGASCMTGTDGYRAIAQRADYIVYGRRRPEYAGAIVLHARNRRHVEARNWPQRLWHQFARALLDSGMASRLICIGTRDAAFTVEGALDLRGTGLQEQMNALRSARLAIGPSSGPMHLASLCKCPHLVWCGGGERERKATARRYKVYWNPFNTPARAYLVGSWRPSLVAVQRWTIDFLKALRKL